MSASAIEAFLAQLYVDPEARARFKSDPQAEVRMAGLSDQESAALMKIDWTGLEMAAHGFAAKRHAMAQRPQSQSRLMRAARALRGTVRTVLAGLAKSE